MRGGNRHEFVVEILGVAAGNPAIAGDRVGVHPAEPSGLADAAPLGDVLQDGLDLFGRQPGVEQGCPLALGEAGLTGAASEHPARLARPITMSDGKVSDPPLAVISAVGIQTAEVRQVVHSVSPSFDPSGGQSVAPPSRDNRSVGNRTTLLSHEGIIEAGQIDVFRASRRMVRE